MTKQDITYNVRTREFTGFAKHCVVMAHAAYAMRQKPHLKFPLIRTGPVLAHFVMLNKLK